ncbi:hypothetical protein [Nocardioides zeae]|uniref:Uncharacterized protein n=1 Tax=Nocardioides zeae TaxID=1457234 RepID=A0A6P0HIV5_9ACTN|nr:hypothetical protein [Nocardioides zeae]NEN78669.1 hypothetical protein [Nocardioides zeae]
MATTENQQDPQAGEESQHPTESIEQSFDGTSGATQPEHEQEYKMLAVRVEEEVHAQLRFIAQLSGTSISAEIRTPIHQRIATPQEDPFCIERAHAAQAEIQREAAARTAAIAGFIGSPVVAAASVTPTGTGTPDTTSSTSPRRAGNRSSKQS